MMGSALARLGVDRKDAMIIGDRMDTDILGGLESQIRTLLVLSGVTSPDDIRNFSYRPDFVLNNVGEIPERA